MSIRVGGDELDDAIIQYIKKEYSLMLGERTAEEIKIAIGSAFPLPDEPALCGAVLYAQVWVPNDASALTLIVALMVV